MNKKKLIMMLAGAISLTALIGCSNLNEEIKVVKPIQNVNNRLNISNAQEHYDYVTELQDKIFENIETVNSELYELDGTPKGKYTDKAKENLKQAQKLAKEYISYENKIEETKKADELYKEGMKELEQFLVKVEADLKKGEFENDDTGIENLTKFIDLTIQGANEFKSLGLKSKDDEINQTKDKIEESSEDKASSEQEVYGPPKPANLEKK